MATAPSDPHFIEERIAEYRRRAEEAGLILHADVEDHIMHLAQAEYRLRCCSSDRMFVDLSANALKLRERFWDMVGGANSRLDKFILRPPSELSDEELNWLSNLLDERVNRAMSQAKSSDMPWLEDAMSEADDVRA